MILDASCLDTMTSVDHTLGIARLG
jgi:hypothetical protein